MLYYQTLFSIILAISLLTTQAHPYSTPRSDTVVPVKGLKYIRKDILPVKGLYKVYLCMNVNYEMRPCYTFVIILVLEVCIVKTKFITVYYSTPTNTYCQGT